MYIPEGELTIDESPQKIMVDNRMGGAGSLRRPCQLWKG